MRKWKKTMQLPLLCGIRQEYRQLRRSTLLFRRPSTPAEATAGYHNPCRCFVKQFRFRYENAGGNRTSQLVFSSARLEIPPCFKYLELAGNLPGGIRMADDKARETAGGATSPQQEGQNVRMVKCVKFGREMPGLDRIPWKGEIGKRVYDNVSKEAWRMWVEHSKMLMNEYRLNPLDPNSLKIMEDQMREFFFGEGAKLPESYVPPKH
jgi:Fe-S cluster biosynthesis and repair protein YggX